MAEIAKRQEAKVRQPKTRRRCAQIVVTAATLLLALASCERIEGRAYRGSDAGDTPWTVPIQKVGEALAMNNITAAVRAWHDAYEATLGTRRWDGLVEVGEAYLRIGEVAGFRKAWEARARETYLKALFRARGQGSVNGVLRVAEAFAALGDHEGFDQCLRIAEDLVTLGRDAQARARVQALRSRFATMFAAAKSLHIDPF